MKDVRTKSQKNWPIPHDCPQWLNPLSVRTHPKFRKIQSFLY